jgi:hypothetical protein
MLKRIQRLVLLLLSTFLQAAVDSSYTGETTAGAAPSGVQNSFNRPSTAAVVASAVAGAHCGSSSSLMIQPLHANMPPPQQQQQQQCYKALSLLLPGIDAMLSAAAANGQPEQLSQLLGQQQQQQQQHESDAQLAAAVVSSQPEHLSQLLGQLQQAETDRLLFELPSAQLPAMQQQQQLALLQQPAVGHAAQGYHQQQQQQDAASLMRQQANLAQVPPLQQAMHLSGQARADVPAVGASMKHDITTQQPQQQQQQQHPALQQNAPHCTESEMSAFEAVMRRSATAQQQQQQQGDVGSSAAPAEAAAISSPNRHLDAFALESDRSNKSSSLLLSCNLAVHSQLPGLESLKLLSLPGFDALQILQGTNSTLGVIYTENREGNQSTFRLPSG